LKTKTASVTLAKLGSDRVNANLLAKFSFKSNWTLWVFGVRERLFSVLAL
jgi:hypothetical protein